MIIRQRDLTVCGGARQSRAASTCLHTHENERPPEKKTINKKLSELFEFDFSLNPKKELTGLDYNRIIMQLTVYSLNPWD